MEASRSRSRAPCTGSSSKTTCRRNASSRAKKQQPITELALPLLKKPLEQIGKQINVPGSFWSGRMSAEERSTLYKCTEENQELEGFLEYAYKMKDMGESLRLADARPLP